MSITAAEYDERRVRTQQALQEQGFDAVLAFSDYKIYANVRYLTSYYIRFAGYEHTPQAGYYVFGHCAAIVPADASHEPLLRTDQTWDVLRAKDISFYPDADGATELGKALGEIIHARGYRRVAIDNWFIFPARDYLDLVKAAPNCEFVPSTLLSEVRRVKSPAEIELLRRAEQIADAAVQAGMNAVEPGRTEYDVALVAELEMRRLGDMETAGSSIINAGVNSCLGSAAPSREKVIEANEWAFFDCLPRYEGYCGDIARMRWAGDPDALPAELEELHAVTVAMNRATVAAVRPGVKPHELDEISKGVAREHGLAELAIPLTGHATGLDIHDIPDYNGDDSPLQVGEIFTIEPCLLKAGVAGTRIEDVVLVTDDGCECLTTTPRGLFAEETAGAVA
jgi:Xaa-Pro aminopeptidase